MNDQKMIQLFTSAILKGVKQVSVLGHPVDLPTPQRSGTFSQQKSYAVTKAKELASKL